MTIWTIWRKGKGKGQPAVGSGLAYYMPNDAADRKEEENE